MTYIARMAFVAISGAFGASGCSGSESGATLARGLDVGSRRPDEAPAILNTELPFRYPAALYARRVQGNVTLRLHVDRDGLVNADSTRIEESSGQTAFDSAAVKGSHELRFVPAKLRGDPVPATILFPVYFRHPQARPLPGDTILSRPDTAS